MKYFLIVLAAWCCLGLRAEAQSQFGDFYYTNDAGSIVITGRTTTNQFLVIPSTINGLPVTIIGGGAFSGPTVGGPGPYPILSVVMPDTITEVGTYAFVQNWTITNIQVSTNLTFIGPAAFGGTSVTTLNIPACATNISFAAFADCSELTNMVLPPSLTGALPANLFYGCSSLTSLVIPQGITNLGGWAFYGCSNLRSILALGNSPTCSNSPGGPTFQSDTSITVFYLPNTTGWSNTISSSPAIPTALWNPILQQHDGHFGIRNGQFGFNITGGTNIPVSVEVCTNLANPVWTPVTNITLTNSTYFYSEPVQTNTPRYFGLGFP